MKFRVSALRSHVFAFTGCLGSFRAGLFTAARQSTNAYPDLRSCVNGKHPTIYLENKAKQKPASTVHL